MTNVYIRTLSTHIVGHREAADQINRAICNALPVHQQKFLISDALDYIEGVQVQNDISQPDFKSKTNLPSTVRLQHGARVMFLNNSLIDDGICNGTIGIVTDVNTQEPSIQVAFCTRDSIVLKWISPQTSYFYTAGRRASRTQFPLQNSFGLTVHKTQSVTLPSTNIDLADLFAPGQAYTAISRCKQWNDVQIMNLHKNAFITDPEVIEEYNRLETLASQPLPIT